MGKVKIALIGAGMIAESAHVPALLSSDEVDFSVIIETRLERVKSLNARFGIDIPSVNSLSELKTKIDAAIVCTPNDSHKEICLECFERGIHVLVEKPLANTYQDSLDIIESARKNKCVLIVGYCTRFWPSVQYVKDIVNNEVFGKVKKFLFQYGAAGGWAPYSNYILSKGKSGGGAFVVNGSHYLDRMLWFFGTPSEFTYFDDAVSGVEANAVAEFKYSKKDEFKGIVKVSKTVNLDSGCFIEFDKAIVILRDWKDPLVSVELLEVETDTKLISSSKNFLLNSRPDMYLSQLNEFICKIRDSGFSGVTSINDSLMNVEITNELYNRKRELKCNWYNKGLENA